jgi:hypothetical protein
MATSFSGGGSLYTRREPPIMGKQLVNFITCGCRSNAPFLSSQASNQYLQKGQPRCQIVKPFPIFFLQL